MKPAIRTAQVGSLAELLANGINERVPSCGVGDVRPPEVAIEMSLGDEIRESEYTAQLVTGRINYYFNTKVFVNALVQYNTETQQWSSNARLDIVHRPLSDIYLVYNENRDARNGTLISRAIIAKMTYLLAF